MITQFTVEEVNLMCIFPTTTRPILMEAILAAQPWIVDDELSELARNTLNKLALLSDSEFRDISLIPIDEYEDE